MVVAFPSSFHFVPFPIPDTLIIIIIIIMTTLHQVYPIEDGTLCGQPEVPLGGQVQVTTYDDPDGDGDDVVEKKKL